MQDHIGNAIAELKQWLRVAKITPKQLGRQVFNNPTMVERLLKRRGSVAALHKAVQFVRITKPEAYRKGK